MDRRIDLLTEEQRDVLLRFFNRQETKQIARELGISPSAVEQRFQRARTRLGVARTIDAARLVAEYETACGRPPWGSSPLSAPAETIDLSSPQTEGTSTSPDPLPLPAETDDPLPNDGPAAGEAWPFPTRGREKNELSTATRLLWMIVGLAALIGVVAMLLNAVVAFDVLLKRHS